MDEILPDIDGSWVPEACTLPTADRPLRLAEFDELFATAVQGVERTGDDRVRLRLRPEAAVAAKAADLAVRETGCCSFFTFTLSVATGELALDVAVPTGQIGVLDALSDRAAAAESS